MSENKMQFCHDHDSLEAFVRALAKASKYKAHPLGYENSLSDYWQDEALCWVDELDSQPCANCSCVKAGHHQAGCEGAGGNCGCKEFVASDPKSNPVVITQTQADALRSAMREQFETWLAERLQARANFVESILKADDWKGVQIRQGAVASIDREIAERKKYVEAVIREITKQEEIL